MKKIWWKIVCFYALKRPFLIVLFGCSWWNSRGNEAAIASSLHIIQKRISFVCVSLRNISCPFEVEIVLSSIFGSKLLVIEQEMFEVEKFHLLTSLNRNRGPQRKYEISREKTRSFNLICKIFCGYPGAVVDLMNDPDLQKVNFWSKANKRTSTWFSDQIVNILCINANHLNNFASWYASGTYASKTRTWRSTTFATRIERTKIFFPYVHFTSKSQSNTLQQN